MKIEVLKRLQDRSDAQAAEVRALLDAHGVTLFNIMGSPGSGKTTLLEATIAAFSSQFSALSPKQRAASDSGLRTQDSGLTSQQGNEARGKRQEARGHSQEPGGCGLRSAASELETRNSELISGLRTQDSGLSPALSKVGSAHPTHSGLRTQDSGLRFAVLEGDPETLQDAQRIAKLNVSVAQLLTEGGCHLKPGLVHSALQRFDLDRLDAVFVENVGNLVCPANFDLGEHARVVVLSVAEGDDKITKYPYMFRRAQAVVLSKLDLAPLCPFDLARVREDIRAVNREARVFEVSAIEEIRRSTCGGGRATASTPFAAWLEWLHSTVNRPGAVRSPHP